MIDYSKFPPFTSLRRVLYQCPRSAIIYINLWEMKTDSNLVKFKRKEIYDRFMITPTLFRNHLLQLRKLELIDYTEKNDQFLVTYHD